MDIVFSLAAGRKYRTPATKRRRCLFGLMFQSILCGLQGRMAWPGHLAQESCSPHGIEEAVGQGRSQEGK